MPQFCLNCDYDSENQEKFRGQEKPLRGGGLNPNVLSLSDGPLGKHPYYSRSLHLRFRSDLHPGAYGSDVRAFGPALFGVRFRRKKAGQLALKVSINAIVGVYGSFNVVFVKRFTASWAVHLRS